MTQIVAGNASFGKEKLIENIRARADAGAEIAAGRCLWCQPLSFSRSRLVR
jgi:hypothetical protein